MARQQGHPTGSVRLDVQGLRALAVVAVVLYHGGNLLPGGFVGVDVFFVVSGFVICGLVARTFDDRIGIDLRDFYARRVRRIMPALAATLVVCLALSALVLSPLGTQQAAVNTARATSFLSANFYLFRNTRGYFAPSSELNPFLHMWSLAVEEQFYLMFPISIAVVWRLARRRLGRERAVRLVLALLGAAFVGSFVLAYLLTRELHALHIEDSISFAFYASPFRAWEFLAGAFVALGAARLLDVPTLVRRAMCWGGLLLVVVPCIIYSGTTRFPGLTAIPPVLGTALMIAGGGDRAARIPLLDSAPLVWIGDRSYSWYLWHWPFVVAARALISDHPLVLLAAALASLVPSMLSFSRIEQPFRAKGRWTGWRVIGLAAACSLLPVLGATALGAGASARWGSSALAAVADHASLHADVMRGCDADGALKLRACTLGDAAPGAKAPAGTEPLVVLVGDSNAGMFTESVQGAAENLGYEFRVGTRHGCGFARLRVEHGPNDGSDCLGKVTAMLNDAVALHPAAIVLVTATDLYIGDPNTFVVPGHAPVTTAEAKAEAWSTAMRPLVADLARGGTRVLVVHPTPRFGSWALSGCPTVTILRDASACGRSVSLTDSVATRRLGTRAETTAIDGLASVTGLDVTDQLCQGGACRTDDGDEWIFTDGTHIGVDGARRLVPTFTHALESALA